MKMKSSDVNSVNKTKSCPIMIDRNYNLPALDILGNDKYCQVLIKIELYCTANHIDFQYKILKSNIKRFFKYDIIKVEIFEITFRVRSFLLTQYKSCTIDFINILQNKFKRHV